MHLYTALAYSAWILFNNGFSIGGVVTADIGAFLMSDLLYGICVKEVLGF